MSRRIDLYCVSDGKIIYLSGYVADLLKKSNKNGLKITGCGMDAGFAIVSELAYALHGDQHALHNEWL